MICHTIDYARPIVDSIIAYGQVKGRPAIGIRAPISMK